MTDLVLTPTEQSFLELLAELFPQQSGPACVEAKQIEEKLGLTREEVQPMLRMAQEYGFIDNVAATPGCGVICFNVARSAVDASRLMKRQQEEHQSRDRVEELLNWVRGHPLRAGLVIIGFALFLGIPFINSLLDLLAKLGLFLPANKAP